MQFVSEVTLTDFLMFLAKTLCKVEVCSVKKQALWEYLLAQRDLRRSLFAIHIYLSSHQSEQGEIFHFIHTFVIHKKQVSTTYLKPNILQFISLWTLC